MYMYKHVKKPVCMHIVYVHACMYLRTCTYSVEEIVIRSNVAFGVRCRGVDDVHLPQFRVSSVAAQGHEASSLELRVGSVCQIFVPGRSNFLSTTTTYSACLGDAHLELHRDRQP